MVKKILCICALMLALVCALASCGESECEHEYVASVFIEATCVQDGEMIYECSNCDDVYYDYYDESLKAYGHDYVESVEEESTCSSKGDLRYECAECGDYYISRDVIDKLEHEWGEAACVCTDRRKCNNCGTFDYSDEADPIGHNYSSTDGLCTNCGAGVKFILPSTPMTVNYYSSSNFHYKSCRIESITIERTQPYSTPWYNLTFVIKSTYHTNGNSYSDTASFGWKIYDEDGIVVDSGTGYTDGSIAVGEKSKEVVSFSVGDDSTDLKDGKTYRFVILDIG